MSELVKNISELVEMLPDSEQRFAYEFIKRLVLAWDADFTKLTADEKKRLDESIAEYKRGEYVRLEDIDWDAMGQ